MTLLRRRVLLSTLLASGSLLAWAPRLLGSPQVKVVREEEIPWKEILAALLVNGPDLAFRREGAEGNVVVRGQWPVVIDYELERPGFLLLEIGLEKGAPLRLRFPADGIAPAGSRRQDVVRLSGDLGDQLQAGSLSVRAYEEKSAERPVPFHLYGLGAGDRAVGSMTIVGVRFSPAEIRVRRKEEAEYGFKALRSFSRVRVQISRLAASGAPVPVWLWDVTPTPSQGEERKGSWDGRDDNHRVSKGLHTLQVTAWMGPFGDWNAAASATLVQVR
jgi:hypothetical protein